MMRYLASKKKLNELEGYIYYTFVIFFSLAEHTLKLKILPKLKTKNYLL